MRALVRGYGNDRCGGFSPRFPCFRGPNAPRSRSLLFFSIIRKPRAYVKRLRPRRRTGKPRRSVAKPGGARFREERERPRGAVPVCPGGIYAAVEPSGVIRVAARSAAAIRLPALRVPRRSDSFRPRGISCEINMRGYEINAPCGEKALSFTGGLFFFLRETGGGRT